MDFSLSKEQQLIQRTAKDFAENVIAPRLGEVEKTNDVPEDIIKAMADYELGGIPYDPEIGGAGADYLSYALALEQLARYSSGVACIITSNNLAMNCINKFGTEEQKKRYMPTCMKLEEISSFAVTEPATGSDPKSLETTAVLDGDEWVINGTKRFITSANYPGPLVAFAIDDQTNLPTAFCIPKHCEGYSLSERWDKIGYHGSYLYDIYLKDVRVPKDAVIGELGKGYKILQGNIAFGKLSICAQSLGRAQGALEIAQDWAMTKTRRGVPVAQYGSLQHRIADMAIKVEAIRAMVYRLAWIADNWTDLGDIARESAKTKVFAVTECTNVARDAMQILSSYGTVREYRVEGIVRDSLMSEVIEGCDDVQHAIIASRMGVKVSKK